MSAHTCHWPGCDKTVQVALWGCRPHWFRLPKPLRDQLVATCSRPGQETTARDPSEAHMRAVLDVERWIETYGGKP
jgi:hypothetical protein